MNMTSMRDMSHRFAAVLAADVAHFSRHMEIDSEATVSALKDCRAAFRDCVSSHGGREFGSVGDSFMAEFPSAVEALRAARQCHSELAALSTHNEKGERLAVRIGIDAGDVIDDGKNLFGEAVNTAARLQQLARPNGIVLSAIVYRLAHHESGFSFSSLGKRQLKNILEPVHVYEVDEVRHTFSSHRLQLVVARYAPALAAVAGVVVAGACLIAYFEIRGGPRIVGTVEVPPINSIAVLPFAAVGVTDEGAGLADGIHSEVLIGLTKLESLDRVISSTSVEKYRHRQASIRDIARELGVAKILEATVRQSSGHLRVSVELIDGATEEYIWAETYDREVTAETVLSIQAEIARDIIAALRLTLTEAELLRSPEFPTDSLEGRDEHLRAVATAVRQAANISQG